MAKPEQDAFTESGMTLQEVLEMGARAAEAMSMPMYQIAQKIAVDSIIMEWSNTAPKESHRREDLWRQLQAHGQAADVMRTLASRAQEIIDGKPDPRQDYLDQQGFGSPDLMQ